MNIQILCGFLAINVTACLVFFLVFLCKKKKSLMREPLFDGAFQEEMLANNAKPFNSGEEEKERQGIDDFLAQEENIKKLREVTHGE
ncbi:MAG: hypothetical protein LBS96_02275 [Oscillospiraceae bacterium]|jgi:hypothetical protein|nr:hypothetical protein [Oscillospiraceae bacterium]